MMCQAKRAGYERQHTALDLHDRKCDLNLARLHKAGIQAFVRFRVMPASLMKY